MGASPKIAPVPKVTLNRQAALFKRRCLYHWIHYPSLEKEHEIVTTKVPKISEDLALRICSLMQQVRQMGFYKRPGIAETLDWAAALMSVNVAELNKDPEIVMDTLVCLLKTKEDQDAITQDVSERLIAKAG